MWSPSTADDTWNCCSGDVLSVSCYCVQPHQIFTQAVSAKVTRDSQQTNMEWELSRNFNNINSFARTSAKACNKYTIIYCWMDILGAAFLWMAVWFCFKHSPWCQSLYDKRNGTLPIIWWQRHKKNKKLCGEGGLLGVLTKAAFESQVYFWEKLIRIECNSLFLIGPSSVNFFM